MNKLLRCFLVMSMLITQLPVMNIAKASENEVLENSNDVTSTEESEAEKEAETQEEDVSNQPGDDRFSEAEEDTKETTTHSEQQTTDEDAVSEETITNSDTIVQGEDLLNKNNESENSDSQNIASGTFGTSSWYITGDGVLHIGPGRFGVATINNGPWRSYQTMITKIVFDGPVVANANSSNLFQALSATEIEGLENFDTSSVTNMEGMFRNSKVTNLDLSSFNTNRVTNMSSMFISMSELISINVSSFDTRNVTRMNSMFMSTALTSLDLSNFDTRNVSAMQQMFDGSRNLTTIEVSENWNTSKVTNMSQMFRRSSLISLDMSQWDVSNVSNMSEMFLGAARLESLDLSNWDTSNLISFTNIFASTTSLSELKLGQNSLFSRNNVNTGLPMINRAGYTGRWIGLTTQNIYSNSTQFMSEYNGSIPDTYVWEEAAGDVTVSYIDKDGNTLLPSITLTGFLGFPYESEAKEIPGWYVVETPSNAQGIFTQEAQEVVYVYNRSDAAPVTLKYQDTEGNQLSEPSILSGKVGLPYESEAKEIPGWYVVETPSSAQGIFTEETQEVVYVYELKNQYFLETIEAKDSTIYVGDKWDVADNFISATDKYGRSLGIEDVKVDGIVDVSKVGKYSISYLNGLVEKKIMVTVIEENSKVSSNEKNQDNENFPKTGMKNTEAYLLINAGLLVIMSLSLFYYSNRKVLKK